MVIYNYLVIIIITGHHPSSITTSCLLTIPVITHQLRHDNPPQPSYTPIAAIGSPTWLESTPEPWHEQMALSRSRYRDSSCESRIIFTKMFTCGSGQAP
jgi:hypothetical protein